MVLKKETLNPNNKNYLAKPYKLYKFTHFRDTWRATMIEPDGQKIEAVKQAHLRMKNVC